MEKWIGPGQCTMIKKEHGVVPIGEPAFHSRDPGRVCPSLIAGGSGVVMKLFALVLAVAVVVTLSPANAQTSGEQIQTLEIDCDGLSGTTLELCTQYCEAMDCDNPLSSNSATECANVFNEFSKMAGMAPPCLAFSACPCFDRDSLVTTFGNYQPLACDLRKRMSVLVACGIRLNYVSLNKMRCASFLMDPRVDLRSVEDLEPAVARACMRDIGDACFVLGAAFIPPCPGKGPWLKWIR